MSRTHVHLKVPLLRGAILTHITWKRTPARVFAQMLAHVRTLPRDIQTQVTLESDRTEGGAILAMFQQERLI
jgi:hypothetical protein